MKTTSNCNMADTEPSHVNTTLYFSVAPEGERPYAKTHVNDPKTGQRETNLTREPKEVSIENIRGNEHTVGLDITGFQYFYAPANHKSFANDEEIEREYLPESNELLKKLTGASKVVIFDHSMHLLILVCEFY